MISSQVELHLIKSNKPEGLKVANNTEFHVGQFHNLIDLKNRTKSVKVYTFFSNETLY